jgi:SAM-dependent methyltransferase
VQTDNPKTSYDEVPYESFPFPQTHPDRLAVIATLLGLKPPVVARCRVLELGCAAGGNLIPMAANLPDAAFVGVDLSQVQIRQGQTLIDQIGLKNIELRHLSILDVGPELGRFDYVLCHGVFSWVPASVQDKILDICKKNLNLNGIAYVSYNTYPGWHVRGMIRDMLSYHAKQFREPAMRVRQARNLLDFLAKSVAKENSPYSLMLKGELESFHRSSDAYLYHEHLEDVNEPLYFHQFAERAADKGLHYLAETDLRVMVPGHYPPEVENVLQMLAQDLIHMEQYMDFLRNRMFRQSLLCHDQATANYQLRPEQLRAFHAASPVRVVDRPVASPVGGQAAAGLGAVGQAPSSAINPAAGGAGNQAGTVAGQAGAVADDPAMVHFESPDGITLASRDPLVQEAMRYLGEVWPRAVPFHEIVDAVRQRLADGKQPDPATLSTERTSLGQAFLTFYVSAAGSLLELHLQPPPLSAAITPKPLASPLARTQALLSNRVTNQRHVTVTLGDFERQLLQQLDGHSDRTALQAAMRQAVARGDLTVEKDGLPVDDTRVADVLAAAIDNQLQQFARGGLLVG